MWLLGNKLKAKLILCIKVYSIIPTADTIRQHEIVESLLGGVGRPEFEHKLYHLLNCLMRVT